MHIAVKYLYRRKNWHEHLSKLLSSFKSETAFECMRVESFAIAQDYLVHYISVVIEGSSQKLYVTTASYTGNNPVQIVLIAKKPIKKRGRGLQMTSFNH